MYIPPQFKLEDEAQIRAYINQYPFATLITANNNYPIATHLPFILEQEGDKWYLLSHIAKANPRWQALEQQSPLVIFQEPHACISPRFYQKEQNVPTWSYIAVHVYGQAELLLEEVKVVAILTKTIAVFEKDFQKQWSTFNDGYKKQLLNGMVAFRIEIQTIQGKEKLSQNKTENERTNITTGLLNSDDSAAKELGVIMDKKYNQQNK